MHNPHGVEAAVLNSLGAQGKRFLDKLREDDASKRRYHTHHFIVPVYNRGDPRYETFELARRYWRKWWGQTRSGNIKGFVKMVTGDPERTPDVQN